MTEFKISIKEKYQKIVSCEGKHLIYGDGILAELDLNKEKISNQTKSSIN